METFLIIFISFCIFCFLVWLILYVWAKAQYEKNEESLTELYILLSQGKFVDLVQIVRQTNFSAKYFRDLLYFSDFFDREITEIRFTFCVYGEGTIQSEEVLLRNTEDKVSIIDLGYKTSKNTTRTFYLKNGKNLWLSFSGEETDNLRDFEMNNKKYKELTFFMSSINSGAYPFIFDFTEIIKTMPNEDLSLDKVGFSVEFFVPPVSRGKKRKFTKEKKENSLLPGLVTN